MIFGFDGVENNGAIGLGGIIGCGGIIGFGCDGTIGFGGIGRGIVAGFGGIENDGIIGFFIGGAAGIIFLGIISGMSTNLLFRVLSAGFIGGIGVVCFLGGSVCFKSSAIVVMNGLLGEICPIYCPLPSNTIFMMLSKLRNISISRVIYYFNNNLELRNANFASFRAILAATS